MFFSQVIFSVWTRFQLAHIFFLNYSRQRFEKAKKQFLIFSYFFRRSFNFFVCYFVYIWRDFFWIAWVTFRWIVVLFSFSFNSHKTNYLYTECKKELKKIRWLNPLNANPTKGVSSSWTLGPVSFFKMKFQFILRITL